MHNLVAHLKTQLETCKAPFLLAVSGGRDSMALLHLAHAAQLEFVVAHLDHALRQDSSLDADFVRNECQKLGVPFFSETIPVSSIAEKRGWSLEEAARNVRYEFLSRSAKKNACQTILTAHTLEDNAETVLMQLLRGTAKATGIPPRNGRVFRPLLELSKQQLEHYLLENSFNWREDPSNTDSQFTRNWLRLEILPRLTKRFPNAAQRLARYAQLSRDEDSFLEQTSSLPDWTDLRFEHAAVQRRHIRKILEQHNIQTDFQHIEQLRLALENPITQRISLPKNQTGLVQNGSIIIHQFTVGADSHVRPAFAHGIMQGQDRHRGLSLRGMGFESALELAQRAFPNAILRSRENGDFIQLAVGRKKLSDILIDKKIPRELRDQIPVLSLGQRLVFIGLEPPLLDSSLPVQKDLEFEAMREALQLAKAAAARGEVPVGAVVLCGAEIIAKAANRSREMLDMTQHAELEALRLASQHLQTPYLSDCTLIVTLEPCLMCLGAALEARVGRIVFAARNPKNGALGGVLDASRAAWNHRFSVRRGVLEAEARALLSDFFAARREVV